MHGVDVGDERGVPGDEVWPEESVFLCPASGEERDGWVDADRFFNACVEVLHVLVVFVRGFHPFFPPRFVVRQAQGFLSLLEDGQDFLTRFFLVFGVLGEEVDAACDGSAGGIVSRAEKDAEVAHSFLLRQTFVLQEVAEQVDAEVVLLHFENLLVSCVELVDLGDRFMAGEDVVEEGEDQADRRGNRRHHRIELLYEGALGRLESIKVVSQKGRADDIEGIFLDQVREAADSPATRDNRVSWLLLHRRVAAVGFDHVNYVPSEAYETPHGNFAIECGFHTF